MSESEPSLVLLTTFSKYMEANPLNATSVSTDLGVGRVGWTSKLEINHIINTNECVPVSEEKTEVNRRVASTGII